MKINENRLREWQAWARDPWNKEMHSYVCDLVSDLAEARATPDDKQRRIIALEEGLSTAEMVLKSVANDPAGSDRFLANKVLLQIQPLLHPEWFPSSAVPQREALIVEVPTLVSRMYREQHSIDTCHEYDAGHLPGPCPCTCHSAETR